jgi:hypothetical protein
MRLSAKGCREFISHRDQEATGEHCRSVATGSIFTSRVSVGDLVIRYGKSEKIALAPGFGIVILNELPILVSLTLNFVGMGRRVLVVYPEVSCAHY